MASERVSRTTYEKRVSDGDSDCHDASGVLPPLSDTDGLPPVAGDRR